MPRRVARRQVSREGRSPSWLTDLTRKANERMILAVIALFVIGTLGTVALLKGNDGIIVGAACGGVIGTVGALVGTILPGRPSH